MPLALFIGVILGNSLGQPKKNRLLQFALESGRAVDFNVREADALNLRCDPVGAMPPQRFIKTVDAYNVICKGFMKLKHYALWLGRIGTGYTYSLTDEKAKKIIKEVKDTFPKNEFDLIHTSKVNRNGAKIEKIK